jgi:hypothetical protein
MGRHGHKAAQPRDGKMSLDAAAVRIFDEETDAG